jgi:GntR family transcriptional regulator
VRITPEEVAAYFRQDIWGERYQHGDKLPRAVDVAAQLGADRKTVLDGYRILAEEGLVEVKRRSGTVVTYRLPLKRMGAERYSRTNRSRGVVAFAADREASGETWKRTDQTPTVRRVPATEEIAEALDIPIGTEVIERGRLVRDSDGRPTQVLTSWYRVEDVAGSPIETSLSGTAGSGGGYSALDDLGIGPTDIEEDIWPRMPLPHEIEQLELPRAVPVAELTRHAYHGDKVVEYAKGLYVGPRFRWKYKFEMPD